MSSEQVKVTVEFTTTIEKLIPFLGELQKAAIQRPELSGEVARSGAAPWVEPPAKQPEDGGSSPPLPTTSDEQKFIRGNHRFPMLTLTPEQMKAARNYTVSDADMHRALKSVSGLKWDTPEEMERYHGVKPKEQRDSQPISKRAYNQGEKLRWKCKTCGPLELTKVEANGHSKKMPLHHHSLELLE